MASSEKLARLGGVYGFSRRKAIGPESFGVQRDAELTAADSRCVCGCFEALAERGVLLCAQQDLQENLAALVVPLRFEDVLLRWLLDGSQRICALFMWPRLDPSGFDERMCSS